MTKGQFSLLDLIRAVLAHTGPASLTLSTWTAGIRDVSNVGLLLDQGLLTGVQLLVDRSFATRQPAYCGAVRRVFGDDAIRCTKTHAKIAIVENDEWAVVIRSSMNLNRNPRFEQYDIDDDRELAAFFRRHFEEMSEQAEPGLNVSNRDVDAVFDRIRHGVNPFDPPPELPADMADWTRQRLRENLKSRSRPMTKHQLASKLGVTTRDLDEALRERSALCERIHHALS